MNNGEQNRQNACPYGVSLLMGMTDYEQVANDNRQEADHKLKMERSYHV